VVVLVALGLAVGLANEEAFVDLAPVAAQLPPLVVVPCLELVVHHPLELAKALQRYPDQQLLLFLRLLLLLVVSDSPSPSQLS